MRGTGAVGDVSCDLGPNRIRAISLRPILPDQSPNGRRSIPIKSHRTLATTFVFLIFHPGRLCTSRTPQSGRQPVSMSALPLSIAVGVARRERKNAFMSGEK